MDDNSKFQKKNQVLKVRARVKIFPPAWVQKDKKKDENLQFQKNHNLKSESESEISSTYMSSKI